MRTERRRNAKTGATYPWIVDSTAMVNHIYFYCLDEDFGPFFLNFYTYFPYNAKLCLNGNEYAKCQLRRRGIAFEALDNGVRSCEDSEALQRICDRLDERKIDALLRKWLRRLPHPYSPAERRAGLRYDISMLQAEFSLTQVLERPVMGRVFFEDVIRENLDIGRPAQVQRRGRHCARKPRSTIPATSPSGGGCTTWRRCAGSASRPTDVCSMSKRSATTVPWVKPICNATSEARRSTGSEPRRCASPILMCRH